MNYGFTNHIDFVFDFHQIIIWLSSNCIDQLYLSYIQKYFMKNLNYLYKRKFGSVIILKDTVEAGVNRLCDVEMGDGLRKWAIRGGDEIIYAEVESWGKWVVKILYFKIHFSPLETKRTWNKIW